ncbi:MAG: DUF2786 domain-containing protein [Rhizomicrobium sp.]
MPAPHTHGSLAADFEIRDTIGRNLDELIERFVPAGTVQQTIRRWLLGHAELSQSRDVQLWLMTMAADLELFTPSASGRTLVERQLSRTPPSSKLEQAARTALVAAEFRLARIIGREGPDVVILKDLVSQEGLRLLDTHMAPDAIGLSCALRLCPLPSGRQALITPMFVLDAENLAAAMKFARPGRPLSPRCAAHLYRDLARRGFRLVPLTSPPSDTETHLNGHSEHAPELSEVEHLALHWISAKEQMADLVQTARQIASVDNLVDACGLYGQTGPHAQSGLKAAYERIADLLLETLAQRARAGVHAQSGTLDDAAAAIAGYVARGEMDASGQDLFRRLRQRWTVTPASSAPNRGSAASELERVIQRIQGLRAKTVERGCTEEETIAAAAKVAELLDRYELTLDEITIKATTCEGIGVETGRKRRAPADSCIPSLAHFCDCHAWSEESATGGLRFIFFGLKADVEAARVLHGLIELTFETESAVFRRGQIYQDLKGGDRRIALNSFQVGLANGIRTKLTNLKNARQGLSRKSSGFDLIATKHKVVDDEIAKLGLNFSHRAINTRRYVHRDAYAAGKAAGEMFEPSVALAG